MTRRATLTQAEIARAIRAADATGLALSYKYIAERAIALARALESENLALRTRIAELEGRNVTG